MITINGKEYKELRCYHCQNFIIYQNYVTGILYTKCPKCGFENEFTFKYMKTKDNQDNIDKQFTVESEGEGVSK